MSTLQDGLDALAQAKPIDVGALKAWHANYENTAQPNDPVPVPAEPIPSGASQDCELCLIEARIDYLWLFYWGQQVGAPAEFYPAIADWYSDQNDACPCGGA